MAKKVARGRPEAAQPEPEAESAQMAAWRSGLGRTAIYAAIKSGDLPSIKIGKRRLIRIEALREWLKSLEQKGS